MRGEPGPRVALGNYPAVRRFVRGRRPPPIILWSIGIITILLFIGAAAMLTVGYLNPFGTVGLAILGVGAVVYFGAIFFLVLSCLWVERRYPGMQPLSFKIYSRKGNKMPPTTLANPNVSGQGPAGTTPNYRMHNELPIQVPGSNEEGEKENTPPSHESSPAHAKNPKGQSTAMDILQEEDHNGCMIEDTEMEESQQEHLKTKHSEGAVETQGMDQNKTAEYENGNNVSAGSKRERKVRFKNHHIEVPFEDYPSDSSRNNKKGTSKDIQVTKPKDNSQHINTSTDSETSPSTGTSKNPSSTKTSIKKEQKEASSSVSNLPHASDVHPHQRTKTAVLSAVNVKDIKQESSNTSTAQESRFIKKDEKLQDDPQSTSGSSQAHERKPISRKPQNHQENSPRGRALTATTSASPPAVRRSVTERESHASKLTHAAPKDSALLPKPSPVSATKILDVLKNKATNPDHPQESVQEKSQTSSPLNTGENMPPHKNRHDQQNLTSLKHQSTGSPDGSPTRAQKVQSPEITRKLRKDNSVRNSPPANRKAEGSPSPTRHHPKRPDNSSTAHGPQEQTLSSSGREEEIQRKKILHFSQSTDFSSSSSPPRQQKGPNRAPRPPRNRDHTSRTAASHSSPRKEDVSNMQSHHSSPSSSSDVPASPSSPRRTRQKNPDIPGTNVLSSNKKIDKIHKGHSQPSSQTSNVSSSPTPSPLSSKKLL